MTPELRAALDGAYQVFARYKDSYDYTRRSGVSHALRNLTRDDWRAMNQEFDMVVLIYDENLLRHFLPRFLEWIEENNDDQDPTIIFDWLLWDVSAHLQRMGWRNWSSEEVEALRAVFEVWTREELAKHDGQIPLEFLLEVEDDLGLYLNLWVEERPLEVAQWLWIVDWNANENARHWAVEPNVEERLEAAFFAHPEGTGAALLSRTVELVRSLRAL